MTASESESNRRNHNQETVTSSEPEPPLPPDGGWGWMVVLASLMCNIIVDGVCFSFGVMYVEFLDYFGESTYKTAFVGSLLPGMYLGAGESTWACSYMYMCSVIKCVCRNTDEYCVNDGCFPAFIPALVSSSLYPLQVDLVENKFNVNEASHSEA